MAFDYSSYDVSVAPVNLPISLALLKTHLRLDSTDTSQDTYLTLIIETVRDFAEKYTKRTMINTTYVTYRDFFVPLIYLRRSQFQSLTSFEYLVDDVLTAVDSSLYYVTAEKDYSKIALTDGSSYPSDIDDKLQAVKIVFVAGFGADDTSVPSDLKIAMLNHAATMYENRGDCDQASIMKNLPNTAKEIYDQWRILDLIGETDYRLPCGSI